MPIPPTEGGYNSGKCVAHVPNHVSDGKHQNYERDESMLHKVRLSNSDITEKCSSVRYVSITHAIVFQVN